MCYVGTFVEDFSACRLMQAIDTAQKRRFSRTAQPDHDQEFTLLYRERYPLKGMCPIGIDFLKILDCEDCFHETIASKGYWNLPDQQTIHEELILHNFFFFFSENSIDLFDKSIG